MDNFRLVLLILGLVIVAGVYLVSRYSPMRTRKPDETSSEGPVPRSSLAPYRKSTAKIQGSTRKSLTRLVKASQSRKVAFSGGETPTVAIEPLNVVVYVMASSGAQYRRSTLIDSLLSMGFSREYDDEFVYFTVDKVETDRRVHLFSVKDIQSPSIFLDDDNNNATTNGVALELELPIAIDSMDAFEKMLTMARVLAAKTNGVVCDDLQNRLTNQATMHLKDKIMDFQRKMVLTQSIPVQQ